MRDRAVGHMPRTPSRSLAPDDSLSPKRGKRECEGMTDPHTVSTVPLERDYSTFIEALSCRNTTVCVLQCDTLVIRHWDLSEQSSGRNVRDTSRLTPDDPKKAKPFQKLVAWE
ncbi:hypothetical protein FALCPG4_001561 [Fusarium falciforme]